MIDSIIFDLDGTLWDVTPTVAKARNNVFSKLGIQHEPVNAKDVAKTVGLPVDEVYKKTFPSVSPQYLSELINSISAEIDRLLPLEGAEIYPGVKEGLEKLNNKYNLFIVSNCNDGYIETFLEWSKLGSLFSDFECYGKTKCSKAANMLNVIKRNQLIKSIYIGDTASDQLAAIEAGVSYMHVNYGFGTPQFPCDNFDSFNVLVDRLLTL